MRVSVEDDPLGRYRQEEKMTSMNSRKKVLDRGTEGSGKGGKAWEIYEELRADGSAELFVYVKSFRFGGSVLFAADMDAARNIVDVYLRSGYTAACSVC
jgi:hypothetical protein